jgi:hypothetical protein
MQVGLSGALSALDEVCATPLEVHEEILEKAGRRPVRPDRRASVAASKARLHWGLLRNAYKTQGMQALDPNAKRMADAVLQAIAEAEERADIQEAQDASQVDADMTWTGIGQDSEVLDELPAPQHDGEAPGPPQDFAETGESPPEVGQS